MVQQSLNVAYSDGSSQVLWEDGERVFFSICAAHRKDARVDRSRPCVA